MQLCPHSRQIVLSCSRGHGSLVLAVACVCFCAAGIAGEGNVHAEGASSAASGEDAATPDVSKDITGPTVHLSYSRDTAEKNPISAFMYFVPLIAATPVELDTSADNDEEVGFISYKRKSRAKSFEVFCDFEIVGTGTHTYTFDHAKMIEVHTSELEGKETLTHVLDYIKCDGDGFGRIEVEGTIKNSIETVTEVRIQFNARSGKSPVTIGLYDINPKDGDYTYENRSKETIARVNTLVFRRSDEIPRMGLSVASIAKAAGSEGFLARVSGKIANLFIKPPKIDQLGQETMLDFGDSIRKRDPEFTFPFTEKLKVEAEVASLPAAP